MNNQVTNQEEMNKKKLNKKGFSLIELIVVIAIMAILVGIVGTQVLPYIEKSRESKDYQVISGVCTAATTAFANKAAKIDVTKAATVYTFDLYGTAPSDPVAAQVQTQIIKLVNYSTQADFKKAMESKCGKCISDVNVAYDPKTAEVVVTAIGSGTDWDATTFDPVSSK